MESVGVYDVDPAQSGLFVSIFKTVFFWIWSLTSVFHEQNEDESLKEQKMSFKD